MGIVNHLFLMHRNELIFSARKLRIRKQEDLINISYANCKISKYAIVTKICLECLFSKNKENNY